MQLSTSSASLSSTRRMLYVLLLVLALDPSTAFSTHAMATKRHSATHVSLTEQDCQDLVAASRKVYRPPVEEPLDQDRLWDDHDEEVNDSIVWEAAFTAPSLITSPRSAALAFVKRLFAQPSAAVHPKAEGLEDCDDSKKDDICYFPLVGFTFVADGPNHCRALPTISNPSCRIRGDMSQHVPYGRWSKA